MAVSLKVAVIGAGFAGLCAARELQREGHQVIVLEKAQQLGGGWVYDPRVESDQLGLDPNRERIHSSLYQSLQTNSSRHILGFSDFSFEEKEYGDSRTFPGHGEVLKFLEDFAHGFKLIELIRFNSEVIRVEQVKSSMDLWVVESRTGGVAIEERFEAVVVCIGHHSEPRLADNIPGIDSWPRKQIHSHNYRIPEPYRDQIVVIIGFGPSAYDISRELTTIAQEVHVSSRFPNVVVSKSSTYNNMWQHSEIVNVYEDGRVEFRDGLTVKADCIIHCTGYKYEFPFLRSNGIVKVEDNRVGPLYKHIFPPLLSPSLSFIGLPQLFIIPRLYELQSKWMAQVLSRKVMLPSKQEMMADVEEHYRVMEENGIPQRQTHSIKPFTFDYLDWLAAQVGSPPMEGRVKEIYTYLWSRLLANPESLRDEVDTENLII